MSYRYFLDAVDGDLPTYLDKALAVLWLGGLAEATTGMSAQEIADHLYDAGHPRQNVSRLGAKLRSDQRTALARNGGWFLRPAARKALDTKLSRHVERKVLVESDSMIPMDLVKGTRGYVEKVVDQINRSFDAKLYDCCAVMCRRLLETLIIEIYESLSRADEITDNEGHFRGFGDLLPVLEKDNALGFSRPGLRALKDFKRLGDLSAHNRRYNARDTDIEPLRWSLRLAIEEMLHMAKLLPSSP